MTDRRFLVAALPAVRLRRHQRTRHRSAGRSRALRRGVAADDDDKIIAVCGALIDNDKTVKADRIKALIARAGAYDAQGP